MPHPDDDWHDDYDPFRDDPAEQAAAERRAEEPPDSYFEEMAEREYQRHCTEVHGGAECDCPPYEPPSCRWWRRIPRWTPHKGWHCGTEGLCAVTAPRSLRAMWRAHRHAHQWSDEVPF